MKYRIISIIGLSFAALLIGRASAVSLEVIEPIDPKPIAITEHTTQTAEPPSKTTKINAQCLTGAVLETILADRARLETQKRSAAKRQATLEALEKRLQIQLEKTEAAKAALDSAVKDINATAQQDIKHLVGMYQVMKPKQAAEIFDSMDPKFAAGFLRAMDSNSAGLIMSGMSPKKSYAISVIIAGKNAHYSSNNR